MSKTYHDFNLSLSKHGIRMGWTRVIGTKEKEGDFLCLIFHTHIEDGDATENIIRPLLSDFWFFERFEQNRFLLCSKTYQSISQKKKKEVGYIENIFPNLGKETNIEMERLINNLNDIEPTGQVKQQQTPTLNLIH